MAVSTATESFLGKRIPRVDGPEKVTGQARFGDDLALYGLLHVRLVLGRPRPRPDRQDRRLRGPQAARRPRRHHRRRPGLPPQVAAHLQGPRDARRRARPASAASPSPPSSPRPRPPPKTPSPSSTSSTRSCPPSSIRWTPSQPDAPAVWPDGVPGAKAVEDGSDDPALQSPNLADHVAYDRGDVEAGFAEADVVVERSYQTSIVHQSYLEPHTSTAADGPARQPDRLVLHPGRLPAPPGDRPGARPGPSTASRSSRPPLGGGFGGKGILTQPLSRRPGHQVRPPRPRHLHPHGRVPGRQPRPADARRPSRSARRRTAP